MGIEQTLHVRRASKSGWGLAGLDAFGHARAHGHPIKLLDWDAEMILPRRVLVKKCRSCKGESTICISVPFILYFDLAKVERN